MNRKRTITEKKKRKEKKERKIKAPINSFRMTIDTALLSPGQTDSQVVASWKLGSTCDSVWPGLACTCVDLWWLPITLVEIKFARKAMQVFYRLATQLKSLRKFNLLLLATTCESVWAGLYTHDLVFAYNVAMFYRTIIFSTIFRFLYIQHCAEITNSTQKHT